MGCSCISVRYKRDDQQPSFASPIFRHYHLFPSSRHRKFLDAQMFSQVIKSSTDSLHVYWYWSGTETTYIPLSPGSTRIHSSILRGISRGWKSHAKRERAIVKPSGNGSSLSSQTYLKRDPSKSQALQLLAWRWWWKTGQDLLLAPERKFLAAG